MALTKTQISELYVSIFNRASEKSGSSNWLNSGYNTDATTMANAMLETDAAKEYFGTSLDSNAAFVEHIYANTLNKGGADVDAAGKAGWVEFLETGATRGEMVAKMIEAIKEYQVGGAKYETADQATKDAAQQFENRVKVSDYTADTLETIAVSEIDSTLSFGGALIVTADPDTVKAAEKSVQALTIDGDTFTLTTGTDSFVGTALNDLFTAANGTLQTADTILDSSSTDADIMNIETSSTAAAARIQNVETINVNGTYVNTGIALSNVSGTKALNLSTTLQGGTATVIDANSINAAAINAGTNVSTLNIASLTSGTRDTIAVNGGSANVKLTGATGGADKYDVTLAAGKTLTLDQMDSAGDTINVNANGSFTLAKTTAVTGANLALTITNNSSEAITVTEADNGPMAKTVTLAGGDITIKATDSDAVDGVAITSSATTSTIELTDVADAALVLNNAQVTTVNINKADITAGAGADTTVTVNAGSVVKLSKDITSATNNAILDIDDADSTTTYGTGTLLLNVDASQTGTKGIVTGSHVATVLVTAGALAADANGNAQTVTIGNLTTDAATDNVVFSGANNLIVSKLTGNSGDETVVASGMTGNLTISAFTKDTKVYGSSGVDTLTAGVAVKLTAYTGTGNDVVDVVAASGFDINTEAGDDTVTAGAVAGAKINTGAGNDTIITAAAAVEITTGTGSDIVKMASAADGVIVTDFEKGVDTLVLTGAGLGINLKALTAPTAAGAYNLDGSNNFDITLKNGSTAFTATNLADSIQLGSITAAGVKSEYTYTSPDNSSAATTIVAGDKNDVIKIANAAVTIGTDSVATASVTLGAGSDILVLNAIETTDGTNTNTINTTVTDFVTGTDKVILEGTADAVLNLGAVSVSTGLLDLAGFDVTLNNAGTAVLANGTKDASAIVQLGSVDAVYVAATGAVTGGKFNDFIDLGAGNSTVNFIDNGGMDTITTFTAGDKLSFGALTGIVADQTAKLIAKATAATSGDVYVLNDSTSINGDTIDYSKIGNTVNNEVVKVTDASIMADVAGYLNNALTGVKANHTYVAVINDNSAASTESYAYLINATSDTITADDITLIGTIDSTIGSGDIA